MSNTYNRLDYAIHPAFKGNRMDTSLDEKLKKVIEPVEDLLNSNLFSYHTLDFYLKRLQKEMAFVLEGHEMASFIFDVAEKTATHIREDHKYYLTQENGKEIEIDPAYADQYAVFIKNGLFVQTIPAEIISLWREMLKEQEKELFAKASGRMNNSIVLDKNSAACKAINAYLENSQTAKLVGYSLGREVEPMYFAYQLSTKEDAWYKDCYKSFGVPTSDGVYMHYDHDNSISKTVIYLTDVEEQNGPFCFIENSRDMVYSRYLNYFFKSLDVARYQHYKAAYPDETPMYYRPYFQFPSEMELFRKLPALLQGSSHFGDDLIDGSELSSALLKSEIKCTTEKGNCVSFLGGKNIHRGGQLTDGFRLNLQMAWVPKPPKRSTAYKILRHGYATTRKFFKIN